MDATLPDHSGHRARLRGRLLDTSGDGLLDYELIEYLLALALPRRDTKVLAKSLLAEFGSLERLFTADVAALMRMPGMGETTAAAIKIVQATALRLLQSKATTQPVLGSWQALIDYLHADMAHRMTERLRVLHLNTRNILIRDEVMNEGSIDEAAVYVREVIRRAIDFGSAAIILVHNHPSGDPAPSRADIDITRRIAEAGKRLNIVLHDHIIIGATGHSSLRAMGLL